MENRKPRIVLAKPGLDGHDKGIKLVSMSMRDAGFDVVYLGLRQTVPGIIDAAKKYHADFIGLSILSGTHIDVGEKMLEQMKCQGVTAKLMIGGVIPHADEKKLLEMGVAKVFPVGTIFKDQNAWITETFEMCGKDC